MSGWAPFARPHSGTLRRSKLIQRNATPVRRRPCRLQPAFAFSAKLITEHPELTVLISGSAMRAKQTMPTVIDSRYRASGHNRFAHCPVKILPPSRSARPLNPPFNFQINSLMRASHDGSIIYNIVIIAAYLRLGSSCLIAVVSQTQREAICTKSRAPASCRARE